MNTPMEGLLAALDLTDTGARTNEDIFTGPSQWMPHGRVFGGQVLAQSLVAAMRTVPDERHVHSMHGYFLRPGDVTQPITFSVERIHDGRSFSTRRTQCYQDGLPILSMIASFQDEDDGLEHHIDMPTGIPEPDSLPSAGETLGHLDHSVARYWASERPFDMRHIPSPIYLKVEGERARQGAVITRVRDTDVNTEDSAELREQRPGRPVDADHDRVPVAGKEEVPRLSVDALFEEFGEVLEALVA
jgi:acyl-CoA thioesterase-2